MALARLRWVPGLDLRVNRAALPAPKGAAMKRGFTPPTVQELADYAREIHFKTFQPQAFLDHYEMVGWAVGRARTPMASWRAAVRTWQRNQAAWENQPAPEHAADPALVDYARQVRHCLERENGRDIGRLYRKIADAVGERALEQVKILAKSGRG
jgi:hypothetical protein